MYDLIIIGAGPAGLTAGIYAGRFRLKALILEKMMYGGQIVLSSTIENFPGFPGGIATSDLMERFKQQVDGLGVAQETAEVKDIAWDKNNTVPVYRLLTDNATFEAKSVVIASGAHPKRLGLQKEEAFTGRGVSYCATCDGPFYKDKIAVVVGGGDKAVEEALFLTRYCRRVFVVHRRRQLRASRILEEHARANPKIQFVLESVVEELSGEATIKAVRVKDLGTGLSRELSCDGVFIFVGIRPHTDFVKNYLQVDASGFIITQPDMRTSLPGVFACGDCRSKDLYQVINACGEAAVAASAANKYLMELP